MSVAKKPNVVDYLHWRGDLTLDRAPFNELDNIILAMMTFVDFSSATADEATVSLADAVDAFALRPEKERYFGAIIPQTVTKLAVAAAHAPRFAGTRVCRFENVVRPAEVEQFAAVTFLLPDDTAFVAFRGTDDTVTGWKEDILLGFTSGVPAQQRATRYLNETAAVCGGNLRVGGHSKGGNLSVWAAVNADAAVRERILRVYSNDGPGFLPPFLETDAFREMADRIVTLIPESSVVGTLMEHGGETRFLASTQKGILQHDPFSWVAEPERFATLPSRSKRGMQRDKTVRDWIASMTEAEKREFCDTLFAVVDATGAETLTQLTKKPLSSFASAQRKLSGMGKKKRDQFGEILKRLILPVK